MTHQRQRNPRGNKGGMCQGREWRSAGKEGSPNRVSCGGGTTGGPNGTWSDRLRAFLQVDEVSEPHPVEVQVEQGGRTEVGRPKERTQTTSKGQKRPTQTHNSRTSRIDIKCGLCPGSLHVVKEPVPAVASVDNDTPVEVPSRTATRGRTLTANDRSRGCRHGGRIRP